MSTSPTDTLLSELGALASVLNAETAAIRSGMLDGLAETQRRKRELLEALTRTDRDALRGVEATHAVTRLRDAAGRNQQALSAARAAVRQVLRTVSEARAGASGGPVYGPGGAIRPVARVHAIDRSA